MTLAAVLLGLLASPLIVQELRFESHRSQIATLLASATPAERQLPDSIREPLLFSLGGSSAWYTARLLLARIEPGTHYRGMKWQIVWASWSLLVKLHLSEQERLSLIAHLAPTGSGHFGLDDTAQLLFGHPLDQISQEQAITLVVLTRQPSLYGQPQPLLDARERFIAHYHPG